MSYGYTAKLPLSYDYEDGAFKLTKGVPETVKQNFKNLLLTIPGEKMMDPDFGIGLQQLLFENEDSNIYTILNEKIQTQVGRYMPFLDIINVETGYDDKGFYPTKSLSLKLGRVDSATVTGDFNNHTLHVKIDYFISALGISDALSVDVASSK
jgi:phage baseplate assembly protein W